MNLKKKFLRAAFMLTFGAIAALGTGCGGLGASGSVSPATFLLPGLGQVQPPPSSPANADQQASQPTVVAFNGSSVR